MRIVLITTFFLSIGCMSMCGQNLDVFDEMDKGYPDILFIKEFGRLEVNLINNALKSLNGIEFSKQVTSTFNSSKKSLISKTSIKLHTWVEESDQITIQLLNGDKPEIDSLWKMVKGIGVYSGKQLENGFYYMKHDSLENNIIHVFFRDDVTVFSIYAPLLFKYLPNGRFNSKEEDKEVQRIFKKLNLIIEGLADHLIAEKFQMYRPSDKPLTITERVVGFNHFWNEVKYNFAFFDQVPDLDWEQIYYEYLPKIIKDQSNHEYFKKLEFVCALLEDGHTNIYSPTKDDDYPSISLKRIGGKAVVQNMSKELAPLIPRGSIIVKVDDKRVEQYLQDSILPYISSSTDYIRLNRGVQMLLKGNKNSEVKIEYSTPDGKVSNATLTRNRSNTPFEWAHDWPRNTSLLEFRELDENSAYLNLTSFQSRSIVDRFEKLIDSLKAFDNYIIDLRNNGGGNSSHGYQILKYFADKPFATSKWSTREHLASFKAWGNTYINQPDSILDDWQLKAKQVAIGNYWYNSEPDTIQPQKKLNFENFVVLIGNQTASAAEDFLIALDGLGFGIIIGEPTFGSTGQPLKIYLPRGGTARICTKKDTYPDGREFVGFGIQPDVLIEETIESFLSGEDKVLEKARDIIRQ
ncbi:S41 family peptidase [Portibacter marinus]|uniref:S41 family peptidase n=1 Tax=Portibacter marinus TaxID=2898660 RepID=UPI001F1C9B17|nr:S41 family peptidase [Portibacter marinus]